MDDILATRYATPAMAQIWDLPYQVGLEHQIWLAVMRAQAKTNPDLGITDEIIADYQRVADECRLDETDCALFQAQALLQERDTRHDLVARLQVFEDWAGGHGKAHLGMTSADLTETVTQMRIVDSLRLTQAAAQHVGLQLCDLAMQYADTAITGRTHNVPAQPTTLGKRMAVCLDEMYAAQGRAQTLLGGAYRLRGIRGAVGTNSDAAALGLPEWAIGVGGAPASHMVAVGQVAHRSGDLPVAAALSQLVAGPASLALTLRLMAGHGLVTEAKTDGQVGSSAMPHKTNMRYMERVSGLQHLVHGYQQMITAIAGCTWNEGDVSDSVTRRVAWPGVFLATDGLLRSFSYALGRLRFDMEAIGAEFGAHWDQLMTGQVVAGKILAGIPRPQAYAEAQRDGARPPGFIRWTATSKQTWAAVQAFRSLPAPALAWDPGDPL